MLYTRVSLREMLATGQSEGVVFPNAVVGLGVEYPANGALARRFECSSPRRLAHSRAERQRESGWNGESRETAVVERVSWGLQTCLHIL